jgi:predicted DCC family thiol-disulfide oxidoreductase YuxK
MVSETSPCIPQRSLYPLIGVAQTLRVIRPPPTIEAAMKPKPETNYVLYDGECSFCTFQMRVITWLDWFNTVTLLPISHPRAAEIAPNIRHEALLEAIHCVTKDGRIHRGARCIRFLSLRMPLAVPLALFLWIPGIIWIAERVYSWVSRNRYLLSRLFGCKEACAIMPGRRRSNEEELGAK